MWNAWKHPKTRTTATKKSNTWSSRIWVQKEEELSAMEISSYLMMEVVRTLSSPPVMNQEHVEKDENITITVGNWHTF
ncbi:hypothetical protein Ahy_B04g069083 isoform C [Arachis hypogaea]|uniref:Uncharacterized protein n=1 Tax=Arachis hypogaea TaxID=3818 RepID=A0A444ZBN0_ARAHY|nr:hypothetical protein Ahy_B04g069083 isoform C [Arachis hypogaea]